MIMLILVLVWCALGTVANSFLLHQPIIRLCSSRAPAVTFLNSKQGDGSENHVAGAFSIGSFVEFEEKKRTHVGKIVESVQHKGSSSPRYQIVDSEGQQWHDVADKAVLYNMAAPNSPGPAQQLFTEFCRAQNIPLDSLQEQLDITPSLLEMAWDEAVQNDDSTDTDRQHLVMTSSSLIEVVQGHPASAMEKYLAWKLLQTEMAHVFFREIKDHGRVVAFKAKTRKAVAASRAAFCQDHHDDHEICFV
jgi:hypothetical protein